MAAVYLYVQYFVLNKLKLHITENNTYTDIKVIVGLEQTFNIW